MATPSTQLIDALRITAARLESGAKYLWSHAGHCNCGHLVQTLTGLSGAHIYHRARSQQLDEWSEYANDYCPMSGQPVDQFIDTLLEFGLSREDISRLEYLSDREILKRLEGGFRFLARNERMDVVAYLRAWADLLESQLPAASERATAAQAPQAPAAVHA